MDNRQDETAAASPQPAWLSLSSPEGGGTHVRIEPKGRGLHAITGVYVHGPAVTASVLQDVPVSLMEMFLNLGLFTPSPRGAGLELGDVSYPLQADPEGLLSVADLESQAKDAPLGLPVIKAGPGREPLTRPDGRDPEGFYARVAVAYRDYTLHLRGRAPAIEIAREAGVPVGTVHGWIREARRRGFLPPGRKGKAG